MKLLGVISPMPARAANVAAFVPARHVRKMPVLPVLGLLLSACFMPAHAGLFDDDEARKAILDLRSKLEQSSQSIQALKQSVEELRTDNESLRRSLLQLNNQNDQLRQDLAQQRGASEQLARDLSEVQRRQKDSQLALDERLRQMEPSKVQVDGKEFVVEQAERKQFEAALVQFRKGDFAGAEDAFAEFARRYPQTGYMPVTLFWLANSQYANKHFKEALTNFQMLARATPDHPKAPEALLSAANCQVELRDVKAARKTLEDLRSQYPQSEAASAAAERLKKLR